MRKVETTLEDEGHQVVLRTEVEETTFSDGSTVACGQEGCTNPALKQRTETLQEVEIDGRAYHPDDLKEVAPLILSPKTAKRVLETRRELVICLACLAKKLVGR